MKYVWNENHEYAFDKLVVSNEYAQRPTFIEVTATRDLGDKFKSALDAVKNYGLSSARIRVASWDTDDYLRTTGMELVVDEHGRKYFTFQCKHSLTVYEVDVSDMEMIYE